MITALADSLRDFMIKAAGELDGETITHAPTIGAMYEGLTRDIVLRSVPKSLDLRIVDGFIEGPDKRLSPQIDAMLVAGAGRALPFASSHVWPIENVIAVVEVKKNLYGAEIVDAFAKMQRIVEMQDDYIRIARPRMDILPTCRAFARLTGHFPRDYEAVKALPSEQWAIFRALMFERLAPVRVILGYNGYVDEWGLREGITKLMSSCPSAVRFGPISLPNLVICRGNAVLKMNSQPYGDRMAMGWWPVLTSNGENPLRLLIELIWTRLSNQFGAELPMDDTLQMERLAPFFSARNMEHDGRQGWVFTWEELSRDELAAIEPWMWEPHAPDENEMVVLLQLMRQDELDVRDPEFRDYAARNGFDPDALVAQLVERRILAWCDEHIVRLISDGSMVTAFLPDGRIATSNEGEGELYRLWLEAQLTARANTDDAPS